MTNILYYKEDYDSAPCGYECRDPENSREVTECGIPTRLRIVNKGGAKRMFVCDKHMRNLKMQSKVKKWGE